MPVDIQATFSKKEKPRNGLENIIKELVDDPMTPRYIVARVFVPTTKISNVEGGAQTPVVRLDLIEPMLSSAEEAAAKKLLDKAYRARTGNAPDETLPIGKSDEEPELPFDGDATHAGEDDGE